MLTKVRQAAGDVLELLYPRRCLACDAIADGDASRQLCAACRDRFELLEPPFCGRCSAQIGWFLPTQARCPACIYLTTHFTRAFAACSYDTVRAMIHNCKFNKVRDGAPVFARLVAECLNRYMPAEIHHAIDGMVIVPSHPVNRRTRGYCMLELVADHLPSQLQIPYWRGLLAMRELRPPQYQLTSPSARFRNVTDNFQVVNPRRVKGKTLLLVDDVLTTGATAAECSRVLKLAGANQVYVAVIARAHA